MRVIFKQASKQTNKRQKPVQCKPNSTLSRQWHWGSVKKKIVHKGIFFYFFLSLLLWMYSVNFTCLRLLPHLMREKVWSAESYSWGLQGPNFLGRRDLKQIDGCRPSHSSPSAILFFMSLCPWHCPFYDFIVCIPNL